MDLFFIKSLQFGILSAEEILKMSVCELVNPKLSGPGSVYDPLLGTIENNTPCSYCGLITKCTGHFGHIKLVYPIIHPLCWRQILLFLKCFCYKCSKPLITQEICDLLNFSKLSGINKFRAIVNQIPMFYTCINCTTKQPKYKFLKNENIIILERNKLKTQLQDIEILKIFENIPDSDIELLGLDPKLSHPKHMIITVLPVLPTACRPYIRPDMYEHNICDDDLTSGYNEIIKANLKLQDSKLSEVKRNKYIKTIQFRIKCLFDNSHEKSKHTNGRPTKCIKKRISSKDGLIRNNCMGKRVDKSARTVIGPDPSLSIGEIAIPNKMAKILTFPERVSRYNIDKLTDIVNCNKANFVIRNGNRINLKYAKAKKGTLILYGDKIHRDGNILYQTETSRYQLRDSDKLERNGKILDKIVLNQVKNFSLKIGDIVERQLQKDDYLLINRQPTLHKPSILGVRVKIDDKKTIRMNLAITKPLNADFDGDENNLHAPCSHESIAEIKELVASKHNIISVQTSKPIICIVQDALLASFLMTSFNKKISKTRFFEIAMALNYKIDIHKKITHIRRVLKKHGKKPHAFNGCGLLSLLLPNDLIYSQKTCNSMFKIYNGVIINGTITKVVLGSTHNSLIKIFYKEYGSECAQRFIDNIQFIANAWLLYRGFSISIKDCIPNKEAEIKNVITKCILEAKGLEETTTNAFTREMKVNAALSKARDHGMKIAKDALDSNNNFIQTVTSGSKGDFFNIAQIIGVIGQQNKSGGRIKPSLNNDTRTLVHYPFKIKNKKIEYESRGFICSSFAKGLNPREFWMHAESGRVGIIDTAMGTATSGYIQRRMIKFGENVTIWQDSTVRNVNGSIIQFQYGNNNYDPTNTIKIKKTMQSCNISRLVDRLNLKYKN